MPDNKFIISKDGYLNKKYKFGISYNTCHNIVGFQAFKVAVIYLKTIYAVSFECILRYGFLYHN